jgi:hypothetical protein
MRLTGKWATYSGRNVYEFYESGLVDITDRDGTIMARYSEGYNTVTFSIGSHSSTNRFEISGSTLRLYPPDGGSPIVFERKY